MDEIIQDIQYNLKKIIEIADEISQEYRRAIQVGGFTSQRSGKPISVLRELLETDNNIRDVIAQLRRTNSKINYKSNKEQLLQSREFLDQLYGNLIEMYENLEEITSVMELEESYSIDNLVEDTIHSINQVSGMGN